MNKTFFLFLFLASRAFGAESLAPRDIVDRAIHLDGGRSTEGTMTTTVYEPDGKTRTRTMLFRRKVVSKLDQVRIDFTAPADIKGLALLILDQPSGEADQHLYTPALRRVRRIRGSVKSQEFADTDFSYEDMERKNIDDSDYQSLGEEAVDGHSCYKIESVTKKKVRSQYSKSISWVDKENFISRKIDLYDREGKLLKTLRSLAIENISGVWTQMKLEMENHEKKRKTSYEVHSIKYDAPINDAIFTVTSLGK